MDRIVDSSSPAVVGSDVGRTDAPCRKDLHRSRTRPACTRTILVALQRGRVRVAHRVRNLRAGLLVATRDHIPLGNAVNAVRRGQPGAREVVISVARERGVPRRPRITHSLVLRGHRVPEDRRSVPVGGQRDLHTSRAGGWCERRRTREARDSHLDRGLLEAMVEHRIVLKTEAARYLRNRGLEPCAVSSITRRAVARFERGAERGDPL